MYVLMSLEKNYLPFNCLLGKTLKTKLITILNHAGVCQRAGAKFATGSL